LWIPAAIITEASLSFLGLGVMPPTPTWGNMIGEGKSYLQNAPWIAIFSGMASRKGRGTLAGPSKPPAINALLDDPERLTFCVKRLWLASDGSETCFNAISAPIRNGGDYSNIYQFSTWLYRIAVNLCLNHLKAARREDPVEVDGNLPDGAQIPWPRS
jgi:hypothetical protein